MALSHITSTNTSSMALHHIPNPFLTRFPILHTSPFPSITFPLCSRNALHFHLPVPHPSSSRQLSVWPVLSPKPSILAASSAAASTSTPVDSDEIKDKLPADLDVVEVQEPNSRVRLKVTVPQVVCEDCRRRVLREFTKKAKIPGFRPGKPVPEGIIINYCGSDNVRKATIESILKRTLPHAMLTVTDRALKDSIQIGSQFEEVEESYVSSNCVKYDIVVDVAPEVRWLSEDGYKNLKVVIEIDTEIAAENACEEELKRRYKSIGIMRIVTDRGLQVGDVAVLDISATTIEDNQKIPSAESKGFHFDTEDGDKILPGFLDSIIGIKCGETKSFPLQFPDSWRQEELRGVNAEFTVECKELFYRELPEWNDSIAEKLYPGCTTLDQVKESLLQKCQELEQRARDQATDNAILDQLRKMVEVEIPKSLFEEQGRDLYGSKLLQMQASMRLTKEQLEALTSQEAVDDYISRERENIEEIIKQNLAVGDIFKREKLEFSTDELLEEVKNSIEEFKRHNQDYDEERVKEQVEEVLEGAKVLEWLREHADIQYITK